MKPNQKVAKVPVLYAHGFWQPPWLFFFYFILENFWSSQCTWDDYFLRFWQPWYSEGIRTTSNHKMYNPKIQQYYMIFEVKLVGTHG
jgi:hypothetical protein